MSAHVDPRRLEESAGRERAAALSHAAGCLACRVAIAAHDPVLLFALLADAPVPAPILEAVSAGTSRELIASRRRTPWAAAAAVALAAVVSGAAILRSSFAPEPAVAVVPRADVEVEPGGGVSQIVDFTIGDTQVVMVYNPELEL